MAPLLSFSLAETGMSS